MERYRVRQQQLQGDEEANDDANGDNNAADDGEDLVAAEPLPKRARGEFDAEVFLTELKPLCVAINNHVAAPAPPAAAAADVQAYLLETQEVIGAPLNDFRIHLATGSYVETRIRVAGSPVKDVMADLGIAPTRIKKTRTLYSLVVARHMHRLRFLNSSSPCNTAKLAKNHDAIVQYLNGHPEEADWWSNNGEEPGMILLTKQNGEQVDWPSTQWLLNLP